MQPFQYSRADTVSAAVHSIGAGAEAEGAAQFLAGGTTLLDLMKLDVMSPARLVDVSGLEQERLRSIQAGPKGLILGAFVRMAEAATHPHVLRDYPVIAQSLSQAASAQLRNMATLGGNLLQRTRCAYFRDVSWTNCNKRKPGSGCAALHGVNRNHAVLGVSDQCIAAYPGDFAQALIALDAVLTLEGPMGQRELALADLHRAPDARPDRETSLQAGELIVEIAVPAGSWTRRSLYLKVRDRASYEFALASAAVVLDMDGAVVRSARIALGGVAAKPWRARESEALLAGKELDQKLADAAGEAAFASAIVHEHNRFKPELGRRTVSRALLAASAMEL